VSLDATGGAEQIMALLDRALNARGHRSIAIAGAGSRTADILLPVDIEEQFDDAARRRAQEAVRRRIREALARWNIDLVHMHGVDFHGYLPTAGVTTLATLHLPASFYPSSIFKLTREETYLNCVSESQRRMCPPSPLVTAAIDNGVPLELYPESHSPREEFVLALGRVCPEKGFHLALQAAQLAGIPLHLGGAVFPYPAHEDYFRHELAPHLTPSHRFLGPVDLSTKRDLLCRARCLLVPSLVPETSSLVTMEAMACGTPVIAFPSGALAELIDHGRTGFLVRTVEEMADAIVRCDRLDAGECRRTAHERFSAERMADRYLELYRSLVRVPT
jgi:glycosyltransferase involved in cell wall biosynthesis